MRRRRIRSGLCSSAPSLHRAKKNAEGPCRGRRRWEADYCPNPPSVSVSPRKKSTPSHRWGWITLAVRDMKPVRTVITRAPHRSVGAIHEPWFQSEPIQHESRLEKQCIEILLLTPGVVRIEDQPLSIAYEVK